MNKSTALMVFFSLAAIFFTFQSFGNLGTGNLYALIFNAPAAAFTGRQAYKSIRTFKTNRI